MFYIILIAIVVVLVTSYMFYRRPLKCTGIPIKISSPVKHIKPCSVRQDDQILSMFPIFFTVSLKGVKRQCDKRIKQFDICHYKKDEIIAKTCIIKSGVVNILYKNRLVCVKKSNSLIFINGFSDGKNVKRIVMEDVECYSFNNAINKYIHYLFLKKVHLNIYCNVLKQIHVLIKYGNTRFMIPELVTKKETLGIVKLMSKLRLYEDPSEIACKRPLIKHSILENKVPEVKAVFETIKSRIALTLVRVFSLKYDTKNTNSGLIEKLELKHLFFDQIIKYDRIPLDVILFVVHGKITAEFTYTAEPVDIPTNHMFGYFNAYFNINNDFTLRATENTLIYSIKISDLKIFGFKPETFNSGILEAISDDFTVIDSACEWLRLESGQNLSTLYETPLKNTSSLENITQKLTCIEKYQQSSTMGNIYSTENPKHAYIADQNVFLVEGGRLVLINDDESDKIFPCPHELRAGSLTGVYEFIHGITKACKYFAAKTSDVIKVNHFMLQYFMEKYPIFTIEFTKAIIKEPLISTCKTVALLLSNKQKEFTSAFKNVMPRNTLYITYNDVSSFLGASLFDVLGELKFMDYIKQKELRHELIVIQLENRFMGIAKDIVNFSDILLLVGRSDIQERLYCSIEFVNIFQEDSRSPTKSTNKFNRYFRRRFEDNLPDKNGGNDKKINPEHIVNGKINQLSTDRGCETSDSSLNITDSLNPDKNAAEFVENNHAIFCKYDKIHHILSKSRKDFCNKDLERLVRSLLGKRIGLVLGGGGARGLAHIGIIQALEEEGIPIDIIGGTSMGAFIGALYARNSDNISVFRDAKKLCIKMTSKWRQILDITYPVCSLFTGYAFNRVLHQILKNINIEDLWIEYFCVTTNITNFEEKVHRTGSLWRYVRASMSLAGYLPPLCDLDKDNNIDLLLDGGYVNNVPSDVMLKLGVDKIIAIDVGSSVINNHFNYGDSLSGFSAFFQRFFSNRKYLTIDEIQYRLAYITSQNKMKDMNKNKVILLRPRIDGYKTMDFGRFEEIVACGYTYGMAVLKEWKKNNMHKDLFGMKSVVARRFSV